MLALLAIGGPALLFGILGLISDYLETRYDG